MQSINSEQIKTNTKEAPFFMSSVNEVVASELKVQQRDNNTTFLHN